MISRGGGTRKRRKVMGKTRAWRVCVLNMMRISPVMKMGRERM